MPKKYILLTSTFIWMIFFGGCDEIPVKLADPVIPDSERVVLIEELSGVSCPNCPKGNTSIDNILIKFPGRVAAVSIHGDFLSKPTVKSKYDFRHQKARDLENWFKPWFGKPSASINRVPDENDILMNSIPDLWQAAVEKELQKPHILNILPEVKFNSNSKTIDLNIAVIPLESIKGNLSISIFLTESEITDAQTNGADIIENYTHMHVLRDMMTNFDGDIFGIDLRKNDILRKTYSYQLSPAASTLWKPENMELIFIIHHNEPNNKSVLQASYVKLIK